MEERERRPDVERLWRRYAEEDRSIREIAEEAGLEPAAVTGLLLRTYGEAYWMAAAERKAREIAATERMWRRYAVDGWSTSKIAEGTALSAAGVAAPGLRLAGRTAGAVAALPRRRADADRGGQAGRDESPLGAEAAAEAPRLPRLLARRAGSPARHRHERNFAAHELELLLRAAAAAP